MVKPVDPVTLRLFVAVCEDGSIRRAAEREALVPSALSRTMPTADKLEWLRAAHAAGQREIEVGSFVPARLLPQLADTAQIVVAAKSLPGLVASVLVPNLKGALAAIDSGADAMLLCRPSRRPTSRIVTGDRSVRGVMASTLGPSP